MEENLLLRNSWRVGKISLIKMLTQIHMRDIQNILGYLFCFFCLTCLENCTMPDQKVYRVKKVDLAGNLNAIDWSKSQKITDFISPWREAPANTSFRSLHDRDYFYFRFEVVEPNILVYRDSDHEEEVVRSERVEIFFRQNDALDPYYCLEMDASGRVFDYQAAHYRKFKPEWGWPDGHLEVIATDTDDGYVVTGKISLESLRALGLLSENRLQAGLFRGRRTSEKSDTDAEFHWVSWVDPQTEQPDFHVSSSFGELVLVD
jgi:hypothetical protein